MYTSFYIGYTLTSIGLHSIDLQIQSTFSDGKHTPRELVKMAKERGLAVISITDHDTTDGVPEALLAGGEYGVRVIPGIEMSVEEHGAHILGYGIDCRDKALRTELENAKHSRLGGAKKMVELLKKNEGFAVEWEDVLRAASGSSVVARPHIVRAIMARPENKEKLDGITMHDFFEKYFAENGPNYVHRAHIVAKDAIALLHGAGCVAVWSHPAVHFPKNYEGLENFLKELVAWSIEGIEAFNHSHTEDDTEFLYGLANKYGMIITAGSDFHEVGQHHRSPEGLHSAENVGDYETYSFPIGDIVVKLDAAVEQQRGR